MPLPITDNDVAKERENEEIIKKDNIVNKIVKGILLGGLVGSAPVFSAKNKLSLEIYNETGATIEIRSLQINKGKIINILENQNGRWKEKEDYKDLKILPYEKNIFSLSYSKDAFLDIDAPREERKKEVNHIFFLVGEEKISFLWNTLQNRGKNVPFENQYVNIYSPIIKEVSSSFIIDFLTDSEINIFSNKKDSSSNGRIKLNISKKKN